MGVESARFTRANLTPAEIEEMLVVDRLADELAEYLEASADRIGVAHVHGAQSGAIQSIVADLLRNKLGFGEEIVLTPEDGFVTRARPDFFYRISNNRGILAEVERGGTVNNNHDLKDLWKAHISPDSQHLFLVVPNANWSAAGGVRERPFVRVRNRLAAFFGDPRREIDVVSLHIFSYGHLDHSS
ncbi:MAG: hypothetical protein Q7L55_02360 [Actinomycetota bacterium]|nr:hypothetical protein [Actinomycetota bacterium]